MSRTKMQKQNLLADMQAAIRQAGLRKTGLTPQKATATFIPGSDDPCIVIHGSVLSDQIRTLCLFMGTEIYLLAGMDGGFGITFVMQVKGK